MAQKSYCMFKRVIVAETPRLRVSETTLSPGDGFPLHRHTHVRESFYCLRGSMTLYRQDPDERIVLEPGQSAVVEPGRVHAPRNEGDADCLILLVQHGETFDYKPTEEE